MDIKRRKIAECELRLTLKQCNGDFSRKSIRVQANNLKDFVHGLPRRGMKANTSPTDYRPLKQIQMQRWDGKRWTRFGSIFEGANISSCRGSLDSMGAASAVLIGRTSSAHATQTQTTQPGKRP